MKFRMLFIGAMMAISHTGWAVSYQCGVVENKENGQVLGVMEVDTSVQQAHQVPVAGGKIIALCQGVLDDQSGARYLGCGQFIINNSETKQDIGLSLNGVVGDRSAVNLALAIVPENAGFLYLGSKMPDPGHLIICQPAE